MANNLQKDLDMMLKGAKGVFKHVEQKQKDFLANASPEEKKEYAKMMMKSGATELMKEAKDKYEAAIKKLK